MRFEFSLARRYLRSPRSGLTKITARLAIVGIAFGVAAMIFALALARGFREGVQEKLLANTPHINVSRIDDSELGNIKFIKNHLSKIEGVKAVMSARYESALLRTKTGTFYTLLRAGEDRQVSNDPERPSIAIGSDLATKADLEPGGLAGLVFGIGEDGEVSEMPVSIASTFTSGSAEYDSTRSEISLEDMGRVMKIGPTVLEISVNDVYRTDIIAQIMREKLGAEFKVIDWQKANKPLFAAMNFERRVVLIIIALVILLSVLNITFTLTLGVTQRRQDIAILRTAGAKSVNIVRAFLLEGMLLGLAGILAGTVIGVAACLLANFFDLISLPSEVYALNKITLRIDAVEVLLVIVSAFFLCLFATAYPAFSAAKIKPWANLRQ